MYEDIIEIGRLRQELAAAQYRAHVAEQRVKELERSCQQSSESGLALGRWRTRSGEVATVTSFSPGKPWPLRGYITRDGEKLHLIWRGTGHWGCDDVRSVNDLMEYLGNAD